MLENFRLRVFREVAQQGNFRRAAEILYISQPAVTQQVKALEEEIGQRLLDRSDGRVRTTAAGEVLLQHATAAERMLREALADIAALEGALQGPLHIAASTTIAQYILPRLLAAFGRQHPAVVLHLESANTERVVELVGSGAVALGLVEGPAHRADLLVEPWMADELVLVVPAGHEWAGQRIALYALRSAPLLLREQGSGTRAVLEAALRQAGLPVESLHVVMQLGSTEALLACVEAGLGIGFASRFALRRQRKLRTLALAHVTGLHAGRTLSLVRQRGPAITGVAHSFLSFLQQIAATRASESRKVPTSAIAELHSAHKLSS